MSYNLFPHYQTLESGSTGEPGKANRSIPDRIITYGIDKVVTKESSVFDLGCNRGFFGIALSPLIESYLGIDSDQNQIAHGQNIKASEGLSNLTYRCEKYDLLAGYGRFDIIICCAFHIYTGVSMESFAEHLSKMLKPKGHLFLEGHPSGYHLPNSEYNEPESYWNPLTSGLRSHKLNVIEEKKVKDRELLRPFIHYQK